MRTLRACLAAVTLALPFSACNPPKYVPYTSVDKDWQSVVPWRWNVMTDHEGTHYANTNFIGPFEPDFFLGAPSFTVRWHKYGHARRTPDGFIERYENADDYIERMLEDVYGPEYELVSEDNPKVRAPVQDFKVRGRYARHFVVLSAVMAPPEAKWGTSLDPDTKLYMNVRLHEYVVIPLETGFYSLIYPATLGGYKLYKPHFNAFVNEFKIVSEGPQKEAPPAPKAKAVP